MDFYMWLVMGSLAFCLSGCAYHFVRVVRLGNPKDFSKSLGETAPAVVYAFTKAMDPRKKESAFLHLPTYTAGIMYHLGTFLSIFLLFLFLLEIEPQGLFRWMIIVSLVITGGSGLVILVKRVAKKELLALSNPDDFISNLLVTIVHLVTALALYNTGLLPLYFVLVSILLLYVPLGKLKHTVYFFAARYHLGLFYGRRGVWPPK